MFRIETVVMLVEAGDEVYWPDGDFYVLDGVVLEREEEQAWANAVGYTGGLSQLGSWVKDRLVPVFGTCVQSGTG